MEQLLDEIRQARRQTALKLLAEAQEILDRARARGKR